MTNVAKQGKNEFRMTVTVAELGERSVAEDNMEAFMEAFEARFPHAGAVAAANYHLDTLDMTFSVDAQDMKDASDLGFDLFAEAAGATGIAPTTIANIDITAVGSPDFCETSKFAYV